jgi:hypothetical protein
MGDTDKRHEEGNHHRGRGWTQYVDCWWAMFTRKPTSITVEQCVPLLLGPGATYCMLVDSSSELAVGVG